MQSLAHGLHRMAFEPFAGALGRLAKQPFDAKTQGSENDEEQQGPDTSAIPQLGGDEARASFDLVRQVGGRGDECDDMRAYRAELGIHHMRDRNLSTLLRGRARRLYLNLL